MTKVFRSLFLLCALIVGSGVVWGTETTIASWGKVSIAANTAITASDGDTNNKSVAQFTSTKAMTTAGTNCYYGSSAGGAVITFSNLDLSDYTDITMTFYTRASQQGTMQIAYSVNGKDYTNLNAPSITKSEAQKTSGTIPNTTTYIKLSHSASSGSLYFGTVVIKGTKIASATALSVKTAPTKTNYKVGEKLDLTGLVLSATISGTPTDVTSGYTAKIGETAVTSGTTTLSEVGEKTITFTYGGQTATQTIHVGTLESIAITTEPTKTEYNQGQTFDPSGMVVEATFSDGEDTPTEWTETLSQGDGGYSYSPSTALGTSNTTITVSYTWNNVEKTTTQTITVNAATAYTVTFNAGSGSCGTTSLTEASGLAGVTLPTATISVTGWTFAGWAAASTTNTTTAPTLYAASSTYHPTENCTLYAVYKYVEGTEGEYVRATKLAEVKAASKVILVNGGKTLTTDLSSKDALTESNNKVTAADKTVFDMSGNDTDGYTLSGASGKIGASSLPSSNGNYQAIAISNSNSTWSIVENTNTTNTFTFLNKGGTNVGLEYYSTGSAWVVYKTSSPASSSYYATKVYIPNFAVAYNSNPAAIVNPTIAWTTAGNKSLYLQDETSYTNAATYTSGSSIGKTIAYSSSDATVASVTSAGVVTALKAGSTTITAKVEKEVGVNTEASVSYTVTVKDAKTIAGLKAIDNTSGKSFTADLTDAVVTYVKDNYAYIQDASAAILVNKSGHGLTAGQKINGAVSGTVKISYSIDQLTAVDISGATVTDDGVIPAAAEITLADIKNAGATYDGKKVKVSGATVTGSISTTESSGASIKDGSQIESTDVSMNLYAPNQGVEIKAAEQGSFTGFISLYNGSTYRLNIYEQTQITLTKNAPTDQTLTFETDAVVLDEATDAYTSFNGQTVSGAKGTVTYSIDSDEDGVVSSINASTGAVELSGNLGTATIKASAAATEETVAGVTTPWKATAKTYTITVRPRYTSTFSILGTEYVVRQASYGATITLPTPAAIIGQYAFIGWTSSAMAVASDTKPTLVTPPTTPTSNVTYYAVYAVANIGEDENVQLYNNNGSTGTDATSGITASGNINDNNGNSKPSFGLTSSSNSTITLTNVNLSNCKTATIKFDYQLGKSGSSYTSIDVKQFNSSDSQLGQTTNITGTNNTAYLTTSTIALNLSCVKITIVANSIYPAYVDNIVIDAVQSSTTYSGYCTSIPSITLSLTKDVWASYCFPMDVRIPSGVTVYEAKLNNDKTAIVATALETNVPKGAGVLLKPSSTGSFAFAEANESVSALSDNELKGTLVQVTAASLKDNESDYVMVLKKNDNKFIHYTGTNFPANRACLIVAEEDVPQSQETAGLRIVFEENNATSLESVEASDEAVKFFENGQLFIRRAGKVYDVTGRLVK